ncbi:MAG: ABC transporter permease [Bacteroidota bacterium]|nr:ABC transporter permease [Bacteroidota bacterium]
MNILQEIWSSLRHNKMRTMLTGLSVSWGIFILIVLLGAGNGLSNGVRSNFNSRATNSVQLWSGKSSMPYHGLMANRTLDFSNRQVKDIDEQLREPDKKSGIIDKQSTVTYGTEYGNYSLRGVDPSYKDIFNLKFDPEGGRFINEIDLKDHGKVVVIDKKVKEVLFKKEPALGKYVKIGSVMFRIIGINSKKEQYGNPTCYIPFTTAQLIYNPNQKFGSIAMTVNELDSKAKNDSFNKKLIGVMSRSLYFDPKDEQAIYIRNAQRDYLQTMKIFNGITLFVFIIGIFTLIAGIVGVSNIMLVSVKERTREIGIRKAIGAPPGSILRSIIIESILITGIFGYFGMVLGIGLTELVNYIMVQTAAQSTSENDMTIFMNPTVSLTYVFISTFILIISGIIAGYMPARRAVRIKPIEAMCEE